MNNFGVETELMLLGFISLMMTVFQARIVKICVNPGVMDDFLPCSLSARPSSGGEGSNATHGAPEVSGGHRRLLAEEAAAGGYCAAKVVPIAFWFPSFEAKCEFIMRHIVINNPYLGINTP